MGRGMDLGRGQSIEGLVRRSEPVERRLLSSLRQAELVETALAELDRQLARGADPSPHHALRASARALLAVAAGEDEYDATLVLAGGHEAVRVRKSLFGLQAELAQRALAGATRGQGVEEPPPTASTGWPDGREPLETAD
jgi:hypothetical protein